MRQYQENYQNFVDEHAGVSHIHVHCCVQPLIKRYFDTQAEPQLLVLVNGGKIKRKVSFNSKKISNSLLHLCLNVGSSFGHCRDSKNSWQRFYDEYDEFSRYGEEPKPSSLRLSRSTAPTEADKKDDPHYFWNYDTLHPDIIHDEPKPPAGYKLSA